MKKLTVIVLALVLILSLCMFTACDEGKETKTKIIIKVPAMGMDVPVVEGVASVADFLENMEAAYEASHPDVDIEIAEYEAAKEKAFVEDTIGTSSSPDVLFNSFYNMRSYAYTGKVVPVDDIFRTITDVSKLEIDADALAASQIGEHKYMVPFYSQQYTLAYNYAQLNQALNKVYSNPSTSTELKNKIRTFQDTVLPKTQADAAGKIINISEEDWNMILELYSSLCNDPLAGYGYNYPFMMYAANTQGDSHILTMLKTLGADIVKDGQISINNEQGKNALKHIAESDAAGNYPAKAENFDINDCIDLFLNNQLLFGICNNSLYNQYKETLPFGLVNFRGDVCENFYYGFEIFDNDDAERLAVAKDFVRFIYTGKEDGQRENLRYSTAGIPVIKSVEENYKNYIVQYEEYKKVLSKCVGGEKDTYKVLADGITNWNEVRRIFQEEIQEMLRGSKTFAQVAESIETRANEAIAAASGKLHK